MSGGELPRSVVAIGGGTGLPAVLRGLKALLQPRDSSSITAVVAVTDDGGSSGRLRRSRGIPPPGDVRNCLVALAAEEDVVARLFQYRYDAADELDGHCLGNLILTALAEQTGNFLQAVELSGRVLRIRGRILPATLRDVALEAELEGGGRISGESAIGASVERIRRVSLSPDYAEPCPGVVRAVLGADLVVIGPGSVYTSVVPHVLVRETAEALCRTAAPVVMVGNLVSERGEAAGLSLADHIDVIHEHAGCPFIDAVLVNDATTSSAVLERYRDEGATPLVWKDDRCSGTLVVHEPLLAPGVKLRHEPLATAAGLAKAWQRARSERLSHRA